MKMTEFNKTTLSIQFKQLLTDKLGINLMERTYSPIPEKPTKHNKHLVRTYLFPHEMKMRRKKILGCSFR